MTSYVAYYRVSTDKQGRSGLGLEAQQEAVRRFLNADPDRAFTEVESGGDKDRPELAKAIEQCRSAGATLIVAKLDRLARDVQMILSIVDSGINVRFVDLPEINPADPTGRLMLTMMSAFAEFERRIISKRTKEALAVAKTRGVRLGSSNPKAGGLARAAKVAAQSKTDPQALIIVRDLKAMGMTTTRQIAAGLSERGIKTTTGSTNWHPAQVSRLLAAAA
jgi:DNA invertase Pin-like site-specific DNA recombinase